MSELEMDVRDAAPVKRARKRLLLVVVAFGLMFGLSMLPAPAAQALPPADGNIWSQACLHTGGQAFAKRFPANHHPNQGMHLFQGQIAVPVGWRYDCGYEEGWLVIWVSGWKTYWPINWGGQPTICCWQ